MNSDKKDRELLIKQQYICFSLNKEEYCMDILKVQEIKGWSDVREIPNTPSYVKGVMNLRNIVVPIIDLRVKFGNLNVDYGATTVVIIVSVVENSRNHSVGIVVDSVSDVLDLLPDQINKAPNLGMSIDTRYIRGMVEVNKEMVMVIDMDKLLDMEELINLSEK